MARTLWRQFAWLTFGFATVIVLAVGSLHMYYSRQQPQPRTNFLTSINSLTTSVPEAEKAWPIYRPIFTTFKFQESNYELWQVFCISAPGKDDRLVAPSDGADWDTAKTELQRLAPLLAVLREGGKKPYFGLQLQQTILDYPLEDRKALFGDYDFGPTGAGFVREGVPDHVAESYENSLSNLRVSHLAILRIAAILLQVDTRLAALQHDTERVTQNIEALFGFANHAQQTKLSIATVYAMDLHRAGQDCTEDTLSQLAAKFPPDQLKRIRHAVTHTEIYDLLDPQFYFLDQFDLLQRWFTDNGQGDGHLTNDWRSYQRLLQDINMSFNYSEKKHPLGELWNWAARPGLMLFGPSRKETTAIQEKQVLMLANVWRAPWDRDRLLANLQAMRDLKSPVDLYPDIDGVIVLFDGMTTIRERQSRIAISIDRLLNSPEEE